MEPWLDDIVTAFCNLGGTAKYADLYAEIERIRPGPLPSNWRSTVRERIERHSSDSRAGLQAGEADLFYSVGGIGSGHWGLRGHSAHTPVAPETAPPTEPNRVRVEV